MTNDLITINTINPLEIFKPKNVNDLLDKVKKEVALFNGDGTTEKGRAEIASFTMKIRKTKTAIDGLGKDLVAEWKEKAKAVDAERKRLRDALDAIISEVYSPVQEYKNRESQRIEQHEINIMKLQEKPPAEDVASLQKSLKDLKTFYEKTDWQEFSHQAAKEYAQSYQELEACIEQRKRYEIQQKELEELRKKQEEFERKEREAKEKYEREKQQILEKAKKEAEEKERAFNAEKRRQEMEKQKEAERLANESHVKSIDDKICSALAAVYLKISLAAPAEKAALQILTAIKNNEIPHLHIRY